MFRKPSQHPQTHHFDNEKIQQHLATINFLADVLRASTNRHHINSHLNVLLHAIRTFEQHRFADYVNNETERAEQVLDTRKIYKELYKHKLKKMDVSITARALKDELRDYATSVKSMVSAVKSDLTDSLNQTHAANMSQQQVDLLDQELNQLLHETTALRLQSYVDYMQEASESKEYSDDHENVISESEEEGVYDYFGITDAVFPETDIDAKPYLRGSFNFSEIEPLLSGNESEAETVSVDNDSDYECRTPSEYRSPSPSRFFCSSASLNTSTDTEDSFSNDEDYQRGYQMV